MDDNVPKPPVKTARVRRDGAGKPQRQAPRRPDPTPPSSKPTGSKPAPVEQPVPVSPAPAPVPVATLSTPVIAAQPVEAPAPVIPPAAKEVIMETIENVTAKTQTVFNDATERAKGAVEKSQKLFEEANEFGKGNIEALVESSKIAARGIEAIGQEAAAFAKKSFEEATTAAKTMSSVKSPTELMKLQSDYVRAAFDAMVQQTSRNTEAMLKLAGEVVQPLSNRAALAAEKLKIAA